ncbi:MAG: hypothetical protein K0R87_961 [Pseudonocardia sp.]|nr:hypothetical protein [Pseudonocardia sp.]
MRTRPSAAVVIAVGLPLLLAVAVAAIGITGRLHRVERAGGGTAAPAVETGPLALVPVDAPDAAGPECAALLAALPAALPADDGPLPPRPIADPSPPAARAWAAAPHPAVLRCGLTRPAELSPTSALLEVNGVQWLQLDDGLPEPEMTSWVAVDRPVYVVLTAPTTAGSGALQTVADVIRQTLPRTDVAVR